MISVLNCTKIYQFVEELLMREQTGDLISLTFSRLNIGTAKNMEGVKRQRRQGRNGGSPGA
jgi:hypothetical protein